MTRRYQPGAAGGGTQRLTPSPTPQGPRVGVQVVRARAPRVGPSAAEEVDGAVAPIDLRAGPPPGEVTAVVVGYPGYDSTLSNGETGQHVVNYSRAQGTCLFCEATEATDLLIPGNDGDARSICSKCIERLVDALRAELPRRRLRLAMERLAAAPVDMETLATIERLAAQHADSPATEDKA